MLFRTHDLDAGKQPQDVHFKDVEGVRYKEKKAKNKSYCYEKYACTMIFLDFSLKRIFARIVWIKLVAQYCLAIKQHAWQSIQRNSTYQIDLLRLSRAMS